MIDKRRFTVLPVYTEVHYCKNLIVDYVVWDKYGHTMVDEFGLPAHDPSKRTKLIGNEWGANHGAPLDTASQIACEKSAVINKIDEEYVATVTNYATLTRWEKIKLWLWV